MKHWLALLIFMSLFGWASPIQAQTEFQPSQLVNPFIGTGPAKDSNYSGNTYPGAQVPWGMVSVSPHTRHRWPGGYVHGDPEILGFGSIHRSGGGCADLGDILVMPTVGDLKIAEDDYRSPYQDEVALPGFYQVQLAKPNVRVAATATERTGALQLTFPKRAGDANILLDVGHNIPNHPEAGEVTIISHDEIEGWHRTGSHCGSPAEQPVYFVARFSQPASQVGTWTGSTLSENRRQTGEQIGAYARFETLADQPILVRIGLSFVSTANARLNLEHEQGSASFEELKDRAEQLWNEALGRIEIHGGTDDQRTIFYTALYHMLLQPSILSDVNGEYPTAGESYKIRRAENYTRYSIIPTWDQFRTVYPFLSLVYPEKIRDMVRSVLAIEEETGWLPKWELLGGDNRGMIGDHVASLIVGAYLRDIRDFDVERAYQALKKSATDPASPNRPGLKEYLEKGYISESESYKSDGAATTIEYSYDDYLLGKFSEALGKTDDSEMFFKRSKNYKNVYDDIYQMARPRQADGKFLKPFTPSDGPAFPGAQGFAEGNSWNYSFFPIHDLEGLVAAMGGRAIFLEKLAKHFLEGHYSLVNEPDSATAYIFSLFPEEAWRTQRQVRNDLTEKFTATPAGIPGNDDEGSLSGVYVFGSLGFFPLDPGSDNYQLGSPLFEAATISLPSGKTITIEAPGNNQKTPFVSSISWNEQKIANFTLVHQDLTQGGKLKFQMTASPPASIADQLTEKRTIILWAIAGALLVGISWAILAHRFNR